MSASAWLRFAGVQLVMALAAVLGWFILIPFCLAHAWVDGYGFSNARTDGWKWAPLQWVYGNPEDGVSGQYALIWISDSEHEPVLGHYMPLPAYPYMKPGGIGQWLWDSWRAYCWSGWRNSCDALKYRFAWVNGPLVTFQLFGRTCKVGWQSENGYRVPVLSL